MVINICSNSNLTDKLQSTVRMTLIVTMMFNQVDYSSLNTTQNTLSLNSVVPCKIYVNNENVFWHRHYPRQNALFKKLYYNRSCFEVNSNQFKFIIIHLLINFFIFLVDQQRFSMQDWYGVVENSQAFLLWLTTAFLYAPVCCRNI